MAETTHTTQEGRDAIKDRMVAAAKAEGCTCDPVVTVTEGEGDGQGTFSVVVACGLDSDCTRVTAA